MGEADVRVAVGDVVAALREGGRSEGTIRRYQVVLDRFAAFLAERGLSTASDQVFPRPVSEALLVSAAGTRLLHYNVSVTFTRLARRAGLAPRPGSSRPRSHELRP